MPEVCVRSSVAGDPPARAHRRREVQRVLHVARGMLRRHVERFEVVVVVLELGPSMTRNPKRVKMASMRSRRSVERMAVAERGRRARQRDVDGAARRTRGARRALEPRVEPRLDVAA